MFYIFGNLALPYLVQYLAFGIWQVQDGRLSAQTGVFNSEQNINQSKIISYFSFKLFARETTNFMTLKKIFEILSEHLCYQQSRDFVI